MFHFPLKMLCIPQLVYMGLFVHPTSSTLTFHDIVSLENHDNLETHGTFPERAPPLWTCDAHFETSGMYLTSMDLPRRPLHRVTGLKWWQMTNSLVSSKNVKLLCHADPASVMWLHMHAAWDQPCGFTCAQETHWECVYVGRNRVMDPAGVSLGRWAVFPLLIMKEFFTCGSKGLLSHCQFLFTHSLSLIDEDKTILCCSHSRDTCSSGDSAKTYTLFY